MFGRGALLAAALAGCGARAVALPVQVALDWPAGRPAAALVRVHVAASRTAGPSAGGAPVAAEAGPDGVSLDLGTGVWQLQASAPGYWSQGAEVAVGGAAPAAVRLTLWPAASLHGAIRTAEGEAPPRALDVRLSAIAGAGPTRAEMHCPVDGRTWSCLGPAGLFDVRLEGAGYAPRYAWDVNLPAAANTDLGPTVLRRAASVFGRALRRDGSLPEGPCRATLRADVARRGAVEPDPENPPEGEPSAPVPLSPRGSFQVVGIAPGAQILAVECPAASAMRTLRVQAEMETQVDPPLLLEELTLDAAVTPKAAPDGRPWRLDVVTTAPRWRRIADKAAVPADGHWVRRGLTAGTYRVTVLGPDGTPWLQRFFELGPDSGPLSLRIGFMDVAGRVLLGTQPLRARLVFFDPAGGEPSSLTSDEGGRFQGQLRVAPGIDETLWTVEVHAEHPAVQERLEDVTVQPARGASSAWVELALPLFAVRGTVVSEKGKPASDVQVIIKGTNNEVAASTSTDEWGGFQVPELRPGSYAAVAESLEGVSDRTPLEVAAGAESELRLVLKAFEPFAFTIVSSQGPVADAAVQVWIAPGVTRAFRRTDAEGRFEMALPPGATEVGLTVGAPGLAVKMTRLRLAEERTITLDASGGRLMLDLQAAGRAADGSTPYLVHDGAIEAAATLAGWGTGGGAGSEQGMVDPIEPGTYALCLAGPSELPALWEGTLPRDRCRTGSVEAGGTLILSPP